MEPSDEALARGEHLGFGIPEIDAADRRVSALVLELNRSIADGRDGGEIQRLMSEILREALGHFEVEERILSECAYPLPKGHAALHLQMRAELEHAQEELANAEAHASWAEYGLLVAQLFVEHMRVEAIRFRAFLHSGSVSGRRGP